MDGVIFEPFNFWLGLHKAYGTYEEGLRLTQKYLKTDYQKLVDEVIARLWKGKPAQIYFDLVNRVNYVPGAQETLKELKRRDYKIGIVSSGPSDLAERAERECGVDYHFTNRLLIANGKVVGSRDIKHWPIRFGSKKDPLKEICKMNGTRLKDTIAIVHEDNDIEMAEEAGIAIAFNPTSEELTKHCKYVIEANNLKEILQYAP